MRKDEHVPGLEAHVPAQDVCGGLKRNLAYADPRTTWGPSVPEADRGLAAEVPVKKAVGS